MCIRVRHLAWAKIHNGIIQFPRWSSEGIEVNALSSLVFDGRIADSLTFSVSDATDTDNSFRYDIVNNNAVVLPTIDWEDLEENGVGGLPANPYFLYYYAGEPLVPKSNFNEAILVANHLKSHCDFERALKWLELELKPLSEDNTWQGTNSKESATRKSLLLHYLETLQKWGKALMKENTGESLQKARLVFDTLCKILGQSPKTIIEKDDFSIPEKVIAFKANQPPLNPRLLTLYEQTEDCTKLIHENINTFRLKSCKKDTPFWVNENGNVENCFTESSWCLPESCLLYTSPSPRDATLSRMPSSA